MLVDLRVRKRAADLAESSSLNSAITIGRAFIKSLFASVL